MAKRPSFDLSSLTAEAAEPMRDAAQRSAAVPLPSPAPAPAAAPSRKAATKAPETITSAEFIPMNFKVPPDFHKRFRRAAFESGLKLNQLLYQALDAWEQQQSKK